jgi:hypothetical protein
MKTINDILRGELTKQWKESSEELRDQMIAADIFDLKVDTRYGKIVEKKETGGLRVLPLPDYVKRDNCRLKIIDAMEQRGWKFEVQKLPRSMRVIGRFDNIKANMIVTTHPMPELDALRFGAIMANELEKALANGENDAAEEE